MQYVEGGTRKSKLAAFSAHCEQNDGEVWGHL